VERKEGKPGGPLFTLLIEATRDLGSDELIQLTDSGAERETIPGGYESDSGRMKGGEAMVRRAISGNHGAGSKHIEGAGRP